MRNGEQFKFVSVKFAVQCLNRYLENLYPSIQRCACVVGDLITKSEAILLNEISEGHTDRKYTNKKFYADKDYVVRLEDVNEFYFFLSVCYKKLWCIPTADKCGLVRIKEEIYVSYCTRDGKKYVPLFFFDGITDNVKRHALLIENWELAYIKFCCNVLGIINEEIYASDFCLAVDLDIVKQVYPIDTPFELFWPTEPNYPLLLTRLLDVCPVNPSDWVKPLDSILAVSQRVSTHGLPIPFVYKVRNS